jgi:hypothetical protein
VSNSLGEPMGWAFLGWTNRVWKPNPTELTLMGWAGTFVQNPILRSPYLKKYRDIKQIKKYREFHVFWSKFQQLFNELSLIEEMLLNDLRVKMSYEL